MSKTATYFPTALVSFSSLGLVHKAEDGGEASAREGGGREGGREREREREGRERERGGGGGRELKGRQRQPRRQQR